MARKSRKPMAAGRRAVGRGLRTIVLVATRKGAWLYHGDAARKSHMHARVDQGFGEQKYIRGSRARERRCHIQVTFIFNKHFLTQRA